MRSLLLFAGLAGVSFIAGAAPLPPARYEMAPADITRADASAALKKTMAACEALPPQPTGRFAGEQCVKLCQRYLDQLPRINQKFHSQRVNQCRGHLQLAEDNLAAREQSAKDREVRRADAEKQRVAQRAASEEKNAAQRQQARAAGAASYETKATSQVAVKPGKVGVSAAVPAGASSAPSANSPSAALDSLGFNAENRLVDEMFVGLGEGGDGIDTYTMFMIYVDISDRRCKQDTPNGSTRVEWRWTTEHINRYGAVFARDTSEHHKWVDDALVATYRAWQFTLPKEHTLAANGSMDGVIQSMMAQHGPALAARRDMEKLFDTGCNSAHVRQMNENLSRAVRGRPSLQDELDAALPMSSLVQKACDANVKSSAGDQFGYRLKSCSCMAQQVGRKLSRTDRIALRNRFDSLQLALVAYRTGSPDLVGKCLELDSRPGAKPPQASPPAVAPSQQAAAPEQPSPEVVDDRYGRPGARVTNPAFRPASAECNAAVLAARDRAIGEDWCRVTRKDFPRILAAMEEVNRSPLCGGRSPEPQAYKLELDIPVRCEVHRTGTPSEDEARVVERILIGRFCKPLSDPEVERYVQFIDTRMSRTEAEKNLKRVVPIVKGEDPTLVRVKTCAGNYLLSKWAPK